MLVTNSLLSPIFSQKPLHIFCDFDGTISLNDTTDQLLHQFAQHGWVEIEQQWQHGLIGSKLCMKKQVELLNMSIEELHHCLDQLELDLTFLDLVQFCNSHQIPLTIVSDGLDQVIYYLLKRYQLEYLPVIANRLIQISSRQWTLEFPYENPRCLYQSGTCKCQQAAQQLHQNIILIGDGRSDFCLAGNAHYVFAKKSLIQHCEQQGISFQPIYTLGDAVHYLENFVLSGTVTS
ncbi:MULTISPECIES: MtnX-like HAD-IB family phosphatase [unclassified Acinetobacter]|uniref:MtnX-like HAD-IB family phosphatase n=1 Tax=unclassified Acinetobacter TaxID=196816 RepID=UPI002934BD5D|nr:MULTISPECIES: MtnX-like HAD-IB family phosphatase [unclassified Acinetobacter]WOE31854.1 MtnX-like HAD-IB family phosphatase [Acinetobacter sp. SAAs470]WOE37321.1 MtnX-like HAD-IB family phosphatase [Acinetobacter sp. SAAs474]